MLAPDPFRITGVKASLGAPTSSCPTLGGLVMSGGAAAPVQALGREGGDSRPANPRCAHLERAETNERTCAVCGGAVAGMRSDVTQFSGGASIPGRDHGEHHEQQNGAHDADHPQRRRDRSGGVVIIPNAADDRADHEDRDHRSQAVEDPTPSYAPTVRCDAVSVKRACPVCGGEVVRRSPTPATAGPRAARSAARERAPGGRSRHRIAAFSIVGDPRGVFRSRR